MCVWVFIFARVMHAVHYYSLATEKNESSNLILLIRIDSKYHNACTFWLEVNQLRAAPAENSYAGADSYSITDIKL
jgi:hypothetical protein